jgi:iron complex outermembrane receptor protein
MKRHLMLGGAFCALLMAAPHLALAAEPAAVAAPADAGLRPTPTKSTP